MYKKSFNKPSMRPKINIGIILLVACVCIFSFRVFKILTSSREKGIFAYVKLLNFGLPIVEEQAYDEGDFHENQVSAKSVVLEALGLDKVDHFGIVNNEISYFKQGFEEGDSTVASISINPFNLSDEWISKVSNTDTKVSGVYNPDLKRELNQSKPRVLIYHTHTTEGYSDGRADTVDNDKNVVGVGEELTRALEEDYGISVIHDKTNHYLSFINCYEKSGETVKKYLEKYGDFDLIIDLHRDGVPNKAAVTANMNEEDLAKIMFVLGKNSTKYEANKALVDEFENKANELFPGLVKTRTVYNKAKCGPNLSLSNNSILIECGADTNTSQEAKNTAKYIARLVAEHINK